MAVTKHPPIDAIHEAFEQARRNARFWEQNWGELIRVYPDEFVAMRNDEVVGHHPDLILLCSTLEAAGIDVADTDVCFVNTDPLGVH